ncbi:ovochymase-1 isoform X2 [Apus apus]|uniref:ovochymase-1 isoform X2 n=1 Tax=Apus apus TaxID=8895 RepID=UPI0021F824BA|nr:ovochymase-1 isoform X2 [Apus apus]
MGSSLMNCNNICLSKCLGCGSVAMLVEERKIDTPNYPGLYPRNSKCHWLTGAPAEYVVKMGAELDDCSRQKHQYLRMESVREITTSVTLEASQPGCFALPFFLWEARTLVRTKIWQCPKKSQGDELRVVTVQLCHPYRSGRNDPVTSTRHANSTSAQTEQFREKVLVPECEGWQPHAWESCAQTLWLWGFLSEVTWHSWSCKNPEPAHILGTACCLGRRNFSLLPSN